MKRAAFVVMIAVMVVTAGAGPALAHRLIIKTSSSIHDVQPAAVVRELLETVPVGAVHPTGQGGPRPLEPVQPAGAGSSRAAVGDTTA